MKKILVLFGVLSILPCFAYIEESQSSSIKLLNEQGFSRSTLEIVDAVKMYNRGTNGKYQRYFSKDAGGNKLGRSYRYIKNYIDPIQDDGLFGEHNINYSNTWVGEDTKYSFGRYATRNSVDNL